MTDLTVSAPVRLTDHQCRLGESPVWDDRRARLFFTDIPAKVIHSIAADGSDLRTYPQPDRVCSLGLAESGRLVLALTRAVVLFDPDTGALTEVAAIDALAPTVRLNDGKVGPDGAFWVGSMDERPERQPIGCLYRVSPDGRVEAKFGGVKVCNGLAWSGDAATMYFADSRGPWIDRFDFDVATGALANRTRIADLDEATGRPDGGACDVDGAYWSAGVSADTLNRFSRDGARLAQIKLPVAAPTMPCFGGDGLKTLFITSLSEGVAAERLVGHAWTGSLIALEVGVSGVPVARFRD